MLVKPNSLRTLPKCRVANLDSDFQLLVLVGFDANCVQLHNIELLAKQGDKVVE